MSEQQNGQLWEYCILRDDTRPGSHSGLLLEFQGATSVTRDGLTVVDLGRILGLLGRAGWELVSVTPPPVADAQGRKGAGTYYFKRPVVETRSVHEPEVKL
jgi:hypothetical protein